MLYIIWILLLVAADRLTKYMAQNWLLRQAGGVAAALPGVFRFHYAENTGVAFSFLADSRWLIVAANLVLIAAVLAFLYVKKPRSRLMKLGLCMVAAGGIGNVIDRIALGYVIDFIELTFMRFAVFNFADICVSVGAGLSAISLLRKGEGAGGMDA